MKALAAMLRAGLAKRGLQVQALLRRPLGKRRLWRAKPAETLRVPGADGDIAATWVGSGAIEASAAIILIHGSHGPLALYRLLADRFKQQDFSTLLIDLPGFGRTAAPEPPYRPEPFTGKDAVASALRYLSKQNGIDPRRISVMGHSFGASAALAASASTAGLQAVVALGPSRRVQERFLGESAEEKRMWRARFALSRRLNPWPSMEFIAAVSRQTALEYHMDFWSKPGHVPALLLDCGYETREDRAFLQSLAARMAAPTEYRTIPHADHYLNSASFGEWVAYDEKAVRTCVEWTTQWLKAQPDAAKAIA